MESELIKKSYIVVETRVTPGIFDNGSETHIHYLSTLTCANFSATATFSRELNKALEFATESEATKALTICKMLSDLPERDNRIKYTTSSFSVKTLTIYIQ